MHSRARLAVLVALGTFLSLPASALPTGYDLQVAVSNTQSGASLGGATLSGLMGAGMITESIDPIAGTTTLSLTGPVSGPSGMWTVEEWDSTIDLDPFITNNFTVTNMTGSTVTYTIAVSSPIPAFNANQIIQSTIQLRLLDPDNTGGALVDSSTGFDVYEAFVNGSKELGLLDDPFALSCANPVDCLINGTAVDGVVSQGFGPVVATSIGLTIKFDLASGSSASVLSRFEIVPEPGTGLLAAVGVAALALARRRA